MACYDVVNEGDTGCAGGVTVKYRKVYVIQVECGALWW